MARPRTAKMRTTWWLAPLTAVCALLCVWMPANAIDHAPASHDPTQNLNTTPEGLPAFVGLPTVAASLSHRVDTVALVSADAAGPVSNPAWLAYDHATSTFYVATPPSSVDAVPFNGGNLEVAASVQVGASPFGVAVDNATGDVFVTNTGSNNVSVLSDATDAVVASVPVGSAPYGVAFDWRTGDLYVANAGSDNVSVISGASRSVVASISVGPGPLGVAFDPATGDVFVADHGASEVTVISGAHEDVLTSIAVGLAPYGVAVDPVTDSVYVTNEGSSNVSVLSAPNDQTVATIPVVYPDAGGDLQGIAYDARDGLIWAGAGSFYAVVLDPSTEAVADFVNTDPSGVVFDPDSGDVCVTNTANVTFECFLFPFDATPASSLTFEENGLPTGTTWSVNISPLFVSAQYPIVSSSTASLSVGVLGDGYYAFEAWPTGGYAPSPSTGKVFVRGPSPTVVNVTYYATSALYAVNFTQTGLPAGSYWYLNISGYPSLEGSGPTLSTALPDGTYTYSAAADNPAYSAPGGPVTVLGGPLDVSVAFSEGFYNVTFTATQLPPGTPWGVTVSGLGPVSTTGPNASMTAPNGTYTFTASTPTRNWTGDGGAFKVRGADVNVTVVFIAVNSSVSINETGLPARLLATQGWTASLHGLVNHSASVSVGFAIPNGTYGLLVTGPSGYASNASSRLTVLGTTHLTVAFVKARTLTLTFGEHGLPKGQSWCVEVSGHQVCSTAGSAKYSNLTPASYDYAVVSPLRGQVITAKIGTTVVPTAGTLDLPASEKVTLTFAYRYAVTFAEAGFTSGTWSVTIQGVTHPNLTGEPIAFYLPNGTYHYRVGTETGYASSGSPATVKVRGGPVAVAVTFRVRTTHAPAGPLDVAFGAGVLAVVPMGCWSGLALGRSARQKTE